LPPMRRLASREEFFATLEALAAVTRISTTGPAWT
jgi:hypothetical protein